MAWSQTHVIKQVGGVLGMWSRFPECQSGQLF